MKQDALEKKIRRLISRADRVTLREELPLPLLEGSRRIGEKRVAFVEITWRSYTAAEVLRWKKAKEAPR